MKYKNYVKLSEALSGFKVDFQAKLCGVNQC